MQDALQHSKGAGISSKKPGKLKANDSLCGSIKVKVSTERAWVASQLARLLDGAGVIEILDRAESAPAPSTPQAGQPDVLVLDCATCAPPERLILQRTARGQHPARILWFLDAAPNGNYAVRSVLEAVKAGWCHGYIVKDCSPDNCVRAITAVAQHDIWLPRAMLVRALSEPAVLRAVLKPAVAGARGSERVRMLLTMRERQILQLVRRGLTNKEVGRQLDIKEDTVKKHLRNMYAKFGVHRRALMLLRCVGEARISSY